MVGWIWIPIALLVGVMMGVILSALCMANGGDDR